MSKHLLGLPPFGEDGELLAVVEAPQGSGLKLKLDPKLGAFVVSRTLPTGLTYPFDWGFIPGTKAPDGDPLDVLVLQDSPGYPGVVIPCRALGVLEVEQHEGSKKERNDRVVAIALSSNRLKSIEDLNDLPKEYKEEVEQFFLNTTFHTGKNPKILGWRNAKKALAVVKSARRDAKAK